MKLQPFRALHIQKVSGLAGSERHLLSLLPELQARSVTTRMCVLGAGGGEEFADRLSSSGVETVLLRIDGHLDPLVMRRIGKEIAAFSPDLVHTHLIHADLYGQAMAAFKGTKRVVTFHSTNPFYRGAVVRASNRAALRGADRVIAISEHVKRFLFDLRLAHDHQLRRVYYGIDAEEWKSGPGDRERARHHFELGDDEVVIGIASRLFPHKGHDVVISAFDKLCANGCDAKLLISGDGPLRSDLHRRTAELASRHKIRFEGFLPNISEFMHACDIMVFPTQPGFGEGFGLAVLEAMAAGRPVIASRLDSLPEIVLTGETGLLVSPTDESAWVEAMRRLVSDSDLRSQLGARAQVRAREEFSLDRMVEDTIGVYQEIV